MYPLFLYYLSFTLIVIFWPIIICITPSYCIILIRAWLIASQTSQLVLLFHSYEQTSPEPRQKRPAQEPTRFRTTVFTVPTYEDTCISQGKEYSQVHSCSHTFTSTDDSNCLRGRGICGLGLWQHLHRPWGRKTYSMLAAICKTGCTHLTSQKITPSNAFEIPLKLIDPQLTEGTLRFWKFAS